MRFAHAVIAGLAASGLAIGCAAQSSGPWQKPGADAQALYRDAASCRSAAQQSDAANRSAVEAARFNACMLAKGYGRA